MTATDAERPELRVDTQQAMIALAELAGPGWATDEVQQVLRDLDWAVYLRNSSIHGYRAQAADMAEQIRHMANTAHQAWHKGWGGSWRECPRPFCADALALLRKANQDREEQS